MRPGEQLSPPRALRVKPSGDSRRSGNEGQCMIPHPALHWRTTAIFSLLVPLTWLASCKSTTGEAAAQASVDKAGIKATVGASISWGANGSQGGVRLVVPDVSMIGLCFRCDTVNSDGSITR